MLQKSKYNPFKKMKNNWNGSINMYCPKWVQSLIIKFPDVVLCTLVWMAAAVFACGGRYAAGFWVGGLAEVALLGATEDFEPCPENEPLSPINQKNAFTKFKIKKGSSIPKKR